MTTTTDQAAACSNPITSNQVADGTPTEQQRTAAQSLIARTGTTAALRPYADFSVALRAGFRQLDDIHWYQPSWYADDRVLDPAHPEFVMYDAAHQLLGAMYVEHDGPGPQIGGPLTVWHTHCAALMPCRLPGNQLSEPEHPECRGRPRSHDWMLHVWLVPNRFGPFAHDMAAPAASRT